MIDAANALPQGTLGATWIDFEDEEAPSYRELTPSVAELIAEVGMSGSAIKGTGIAGRVRRSDVMAAVRALLDASLVDTKMNQPSQTSRDMGAVLQFGFAITMRSIDVDAGQSRALDELATVAMSVATGHSWWPSNGTLSLERMTESSERVDAIVAPPESTNSDVAMVVGDFGDAPVQVGSGELRNGCLMRLDLGAVTWRPTLSPGGHLSLVPSATVTLTFDSSKISTTQTAEFVTRLCRGLDGTA